MALKNNGTCLFLQDRLCLTVEVASQLNKFVSFKLRVTDQQRSRFTIVKIKKRLLKNCSKTVGRSVRRVTRVNINDLLRAVSYIRNHH